MKTGKSLVEMAQELERIKAAARDFVVPTANLHAEAVSTGPESDSKKLVLAFDKNGENQQFALNSWSSSQVAGYTDIPKAYFDRIQTENPSLLADNINHGLEKVSAVA